MANLTQATKLLDSMLKSLDYLDQMERNNVSNRSRSALSKRDQQLLAQVKQDNIEYIRFETCDLYARSIGKLIHVSHLKDRLLNGIDIPKPAWGIVGNHNAFYVNATFHNSANVKCFPYHSTYCKLPPALCTKANIGRIMYYPTSASDNPTFFNVNPRTLCLTQLSKLKEHFKMDLYSCFEHEFTVFHNPKSETAALEPVWDHKHFMDNSALSEHESFMIDCERSLRSMNVNIESMQLEFGPGCFEWSLKPSWGIKAGDDSFTYKSIIKQIGIKHDYLASFATTPQCEDTSGCSNGAHFNHSLWRNGKNLFYDSQTDDKLSLIAKYWIGGILKHIKGITCFAVPTVNCYRRVRNHVWAPSVGSWGFDNRLCMIRVKRDGNKGTYLEYRLSCAACNPYLVLASVIMAGMDGIRNKLLPNQPISDDPLSEKYASEMKQIPEYLSDALDELGSDDVICEGFGDMFIESFVAMKKMEIDVFDKLTEQLDGSKDRAEKQMFSTL